MLWGRGVERQLEVSAFSVEEPPSQRRWLVQGHVARVQGDTQTVPILRLPFPAPPLPLPKLKTPLNPKVTSSFGKRKAKEVTPRCVCLF